MNYKIIICTSTKIFLHYNDRNEKKKSYWKLITIMCLTVVYSLIFQFFAEKFLIFHLKNFYSNVSEWVRFSHFFFLEVPNFLFAVALNFKSWYNRNNPEFDISYFSGVWLKEFTNQYRFKCDEHDILFTNVRIFFHILWMIEVQHSHCGHKRCVLTLL